MADDDHSSTHVGDLKAIASIEDDDEDNTHDEAHFKQIALHREQRCAEDIESHEGIAAGKDEKSTAHNGEDIAAHEIQQLSAARKLRLPELEESLDLSCSDDRLRQQQLRAARKLRIPELKESLDLGCSDERLRHKQLREA